MGSLLGHALLLSLLVIVPVTSGQDTAAVIIGGYSIEAKEATGDNLLTMVEIFGCPGYEGRSNWINDYPLKVYHSAGVWNGRDIVSCGGFSCVDAETDCFMTTECVVWQQGDSLWHGFPPLLEPLIDFFMLRAPEERSLLTVGPDMDTQMYIPGNDTWVPYWDMPEGRDYHSSSACMVQFGDAVYHIGSSDVMRLDLIDWNNSIIGNVPEFLEDAGRCAISEINGKSGG